MATPSNRTVILGVVVGCLSLFTCTLGILAAIAVPAFQKYVRRANAQEAHINLDTLAMAYRSRCGSEVYDPVTGLAQPHAPLGAAGPIPAVPGEQKQLGAFAADPVFSELHFDPGMPGYYSYSVQPNAAGVLFLAEGDLDGNGVRSRFELQCDLACNCAATTVTNELE